MSGAASQFRYSFPGRGMAEVTSSPGESEGLPGGSRGELSDRQDCGVRKREIERRGLGFE